MSTPSTVFHSEDLRAAIDSSREFIEKHEELRDRISDDIKSLESYLQHSGLKEAFRLEFGETPALDDDVLRAFDADRAVCCEIHREALVWKSDQKGRFRLHYELSKWDGSVDVDAPGGPYAWDPSTLRCDCRPLIEAPFEVRRSIYGKLPEFVRAIASQIAERAGIDDPFIDDIPF